jgi:thiol:disulfide interchange protein DsbD
MLVPAIANADDGSFAKYEERGLLWMYLASFGFGVLTSLTPCVYPMIPITLAIFGARGKDVSKRRAILLATAYVGGMGLTYSVLGVVFAEIGKAGSFGSQLSSPWIVFPLVALFVALATSMFGAFELALPSALQGRLNRVGGRGFGGAFAMGLVGGLIAAPCTGPFLAGLLAYVSTTGSAIGGGSLLFTYAIGMGVLFWVLAAFALALPKSGGWMDSVKSLSGIGLLFAAIYYLGPFMPWLKNVASPHYWFLVVALVVGITGIALGAITLSFHGTGREKARKAVGVTLVLASAIGIWMWNLAPKQHMPWDHDESSALARAHTEHKGLMIDFAATWCAPCQEMERTFGEPDVYDAIVADFVPLQLDVSEGSDADMTRRDHYKADTLPAVVFISADGTVVARVAKFTEAQDMLTVVRDAARKLHASASK